MGTEHRPEVWLRGALPDVSPLLMPAAHCLLQCREEIEAAVSGLTVDQLWARPAGVASVGFHLRHVAGSLDRLLTYARGAQLDREQMVVLRAEADPGAHTETPAMLVSAAQAAIDAAIATLRATPDTDLMQARSVGRAGLPSNVFGLLFHAAEHTHRHTGQLVTTAKLVAAGA
jgi:uncharacterized damage-inducible protein DinB